MCDDRHLFRMAVRAVGSTLVYCYKCTNVGFVNSLPRGWRTWVPLYRIPLKANHRRLRLQWAQEYRAWQADWQQVMNHASICGNMRAAVVLDVMPSECCLPECVIERHSGLTPGVMVWRAISYHGRSNLLRIESYPNSNRYVREVLQPEVISFLRGTPGAIFQQDNTSLHIAKTVRDFCSA
ncbi:UNVERIFIED_CONTAM: hypothetical protein NCL1_60088 [Trichonephila clavipes]